MILKDNADLARFVMDNNLLESGMPSGRRIRVDFAYSETPTFDTFDHYKDWEHYSCPWDLGTKRVHKRRGARTYSTKRYKPYY